MKTKLFAPEIDKFTETLNMDGIPSTSEMRMNLKKLYQVFSVVKPGESDDFRSISDSIHMNLLLMAFLIAFIFRLAVGSATVATLTTAPIMLPLAQQTGASPELMVLATGAEV